MSFSSDDSTGVHVLALTYAAKLDTPCKARTFPSPSVAGPGGGIGSAPGFNISLMRRKVLPPLSTLPSAFGYRCVR